MGTSTAWRGPGGNTGLRRRWSTLQGGLTRWQSRYTQAGGEGGAAAELSLRAVQELTAQADAYVDALRETCREDEHAFGLQDAAFAAGERLATAMAALAASGTAGLASEDGPHFEDPATAFVAELTNAVAGDGGTLADAAVRRAAAKAGRLLVRHYPEVLGAPTGAEDASSGRGFVGELLCFLYKTFFAEFVAEFLRAVVAENLRLAVPVLAMDRSPESFTDHIATRIVGLVPDPCEEHTEHEQTAVAAEGPLGGEPALLLPDVARRLVPRTVRAVLGLPQGAEEAAA